MGRRSSDVEVLDHALGDRHPLGVGASAVRELECVRPVRQPQVVASVRERRVADHLADGVVPTRQKKEFRNFHPDANEELHLGQERSKTQRRACGLVW